MMELPSVGHTTVGNEGVIASDDSTLASDIRQPWVANWRFALAVLLVARSAAVFAVAFRWALAYVLRQVAGTTDVVSAMIHAPIWARLARACHPGIGVPGGGL